MSTAAEAAQTVSQYNNTAVGLADRVDANKEKPRYVFCLGDHTSDQDKAGFESIGGHFGGLWVGHSETEGCPTMKRTNFMIYRGAITPLETTAIPKKADHRERERQNENFLVGKDVPPGVRGYTVYAGNDLNYLQSDRFRPMGVVELQALKYKSWTESNALQLQLLLFPRWNDWLNGVKAPVLLDDWMMEVNNAFNKFPDLQAFSTDVFESSRLFRTYGLGHIERNRQQIMAKRSVDTGGMFVSWSGTSRLYAKQLGVVLENEDQLRPSGNNMSTGDPAMIQEMREERRLRSEELKQQREMISLLTSFVKDKLGETPFDGYAKEFTGEVEGPEVQEDLSANVSYGVDPASVNLEEAQVTGVPEESQERKDFDAALQDPQFEAALEDDPGLRGAVRENPALSGAIEEEE